MPAPQLKGLAHLVIRVRDIDRAVEFYKTVLGLEVQHEFPGMVFLNSPGAEVSHELGIFSAGADAPGPDPHRVGMYHFAWQVGSIEELEGFHRHALERHVNIVGYGDHGAAFGIYVTDPDGNEIEVFYELPPDQWPGGGDNFRGHFPLSIDIEPVRTS